MDNGEKFRAKVWTIEKNQGKGNSAKRWQSVRTGMVAAFPHEWFPINGFPVWESFKIKQN